MTDNSASYEHDYQRLLDLAKIRRADEQRRRVADLMRERADARGYLLGQRARLIGDAMIARPDWAEADATAWVDSAFGRDSSD